METISPRDESGGDLCGDGAHDSLLRGAGFAVPAGDDGADACQQEFEGEIVSC